MRTPWAEPSRNESMWILFRSTVPKNVPTQAKAGRIPDEIYQPSRFNTLTACMSSLSLSVRKCERLSLFIDGQRCTSPVLGETGKNDIPIATRLHYVGQRLFSLQSPAPDPEATVASPEAPLLQQLPDPNRNQYVKASLKTHCQARC